MKNTRRRRRAWLSHAAAVALLVALGASTAMAQTPDPGLTKALKGASLEDLGNIEITSVSKQAELLSDAPAAIYVITNEDIRRSGYRRLPDILRLAPNLQVAQINGQSYAISARGFNSSTANKLLVLIDGRSVYTPLFSGVFWESQDVVPEDIDRIEVISGPGGTLWGTNAVNGVINVVTKHSRDTQGGLAFLGGGNRSIEGVARYGGKFGESGSYRVYGKGFEQRHNDTAAGSRARDQWSRGQAGMRMDWSQERDAFTLQGDVYENSLEQSLPLDAWESGRNVLGRWTRGLAGGSTLQVQAYYDRSERSFPGSYADTLDTFDVEAQHSFLLGESHHIVWGGGYRHWRDEFTSLSSTLLFLPPRKSVSLGNLFAQDTMTLNPNLKLSLGLRLETNDYTGLEPLPSARLSWKVADNALLWGAVSRAVRSPSRIDRDFFQPPLLVGGSFIDEKLIAYEIGYRQQISPRAALSISTFYNVYDELRSIETTATGGFPLVIGNTMKGTTYGVEVWGNYLVTDWWRLTGGFNLLHKELSFAAGSRDIGGVQGAGNDPEHQVFLRSSMNLTPQVELDLGVRAVGGLPNPVVPSYVAVDARVGWHVSDTVDVSLTGTNLLDRSHPEFGAAVPGRVVLGRTVFLGLRGRF